ncbi:MAG: hypothetical protein H6815_09590 [Phycisphaeraceae bacterium]|nr:hypothetical protein [Phycisphaerales bacterium]MCB9860690.1 hypothetical protein [Phycisphaeraceae bacterium]
MKICGKMIGATAVFALAAAATASPFSQLKFDINGMDVNFTSGANGTGAALATVSSGGGLNFTGSWELTFGNAFLVGGGARGNNLSSGAGPFSFAGTATLTSITGFLNFTNGSLTGGSFEFGVSNNGGGNDFIQGNFSNSGSSNITGAVPGGPWFVTGLVINSVFVDNDGDTQFGDNIDMAKFVGQIFGGSFSEIFLSDNGTNGDFDIIIEAPGVPTPMAAAMGVLGLAGIGSQRRRRTV